MAGRKFTKQPKQHGGFSSLHARYYLCLCNLFLDTKRANPWLESMETKNSPARWLPTNKAQCEYSLPFRYFHVFIWLDLFIFSSLNSNTARQTFRHRNRATGQIVHTLIIHSKQLTEPQIKQLKSTLGGEIHQIDNHFRQTLHKLDKKAIARLSLQLKIDLNILPADFKGNNIKMFISDMDSTLIGIECIDEIADMNNIKPQVAKITESAMRGDIDFEGSLTQRVSLLKGIKTSALETVFTERLFLNKGAEEWIEGLKNKKLTFALVSGGFTFFTDRLQNQLNLDFSRANVLEEKNGKLTGKVIGKIIGAEAKAEFLHELCKKQNIKSQQVIAIGDGANDLAMMREAGLSIAYRAKPAVQAQASAVFNYSSLDSALDFLS